MVTPGELHMSDTVLIVGAGMVGLALARALQRSGIPFQIVDPRPGVHEGSLVWQSGDAIPATMRVSALSPGSLSFLSRLGVDTARLLGMPFSGMQVWGGSGTGHLDFAATGRIAVNASVEAALADGIEVQWRTRLTELDTSDRLVAAKLVHDDGQTQDVQVALIAGADGASSMVRTWTS